MVLAAIGLVSTTVDHRAWHDVWPSLASVASYVHNVNYLRISPLLTEVGPYWSVSVEMQFYVGFAVVAFVLWRLRASPTVWVGLVVAVAMARAWRAAVGVAAYRGPTCRHRSPRRGCGACSWRWRRGGAG